MVHSRFVLSIVALFAFAGEVSAQQVELLDFYLPTCGPCKQMEPLVARLEAEGVAVRKVDGSREARLASQLRVQSYPTFVLMVDGREAGRLVGATGYGELRRLVASAQAAPTRQANAQTFAGRPKPTKGTFANVSNDRGPGTSAPPRPGTTPPVATVNDAAAKALVVRSVRLTIAEGSSSSFGTGTVIDARSGEALVVTCAHLFKDANEQLIETDGKIAVELFDSNARVMERVQGQLISHDFKSDVALVAIRPSNAVQAASVASSPGAQQLNDAVRSVGCDLGADPTVREHRVVDLNRYNGPPNIEASGAPVQGRSGGGLFNASSQLIGICNFADDAANEGIYAGLASIHAQLDRIGLSSLYQNQSAAPPVAAFAQASANVPATAPPAASREIEPVQRTPVVRGQNAVPEFSLDNPPPAQEEGTLTATEQATLGEIASRSSGAEVTILIHPSDGGRTEVLTLDSASPQFVGALRKLGLTR